MKFIYNIKLNSLGLLVLVLFSVKQVFNYKQSLVLII